MVQKKFGVLIFTVISLVLLSNLISAEVIIKKTEVSSMAVPELNLPAIFTLEITNRGADDVFTIYSLAGVRIEPNYTVSISNAGTQTVTLKAYPTFPSTVSPDYYSFEYKIKGDKAGIQSDQLAISIVELQDAFNFNVEDINLDSKTAVVNFENKGGHNFGNTKVQMSSVLFDVNFDLEMGPYASKKVEVPLSSDKLKQTLAGIYAIDSKISALGIISSKVISVRFTEQPNIVTTESSSGFFINQYQIEKKNTGNIKTDVSAGVTKNMLAGLFTSFNIPPTRKQVSGFSITYIFEKELLPNSSLTLIAITNWWMMLAVIAGIILIYYIVDKYIREKIVLRKTISLVRTKGGEFALRITLKARARDFVEKIRILDRLPPMVKLFEKPGLSAPDRVDSQNRRLEWNVSALGKGEEREYSYIIYSKIGMVGKFELPSAEAIYEYKGKLKESQSNRAFFVNEPQKI